MARFVFSLLALVFIATASFAQGREGGGVGAGEYQQYYLIAMEAIPEAERADYVLVSARSEAVTAATNGRVGFYFYNNRKNKMREIEVDREKKKIIKDTDDKDKVSQDMLNLIAKANKSKAKLPDGRLMEIAKDQIKNGSFSEVKYENKDGTLVITFGETSINAETGKVVEKK
jgi:hypothetical protein